MYGGNREKEKTHILQTWVIVVKCRIVLLPSGNAEFDQVVPAEPDIGDVVLFLQEVQDGQCLGVLSIAFAVLVEFIIFIFLLHLQYN